MTLHRPFLSIALLLAARAAWPQGDPLGPEFRVNTYTTGYQAFPVVAADASGAFVVVWASDGQDGSGFGVFGQRYDAGGAPLGSEFRVNTYTTNGQRVPAVAAGPTGTFVVVWRSDDQDGSSYGVFGQRFAGSGVSLGPEFRVNTYTTENQGIPAVATDPAGNFVVVWHSRTQDGSGFGVFGQRYASSGAPTGPEFRINTYTMVDQAGPAVVADPSGNFMVVWRSFTQDGSADGVFGQRYSSSGAPLGSEFRVNTYTTGEQVYPAVSSDTSGDFVVAWMDNGQDGSNYGVFGQRYDGAGAPIGPEFRINTYTTDHQMFPAVAADPAGDFVVVWRSFTQDGSASGVFGQRYSAAGGSLGPEFRVNTHTTNNQIFPTVASDTAGNFVVVWHSQSQDGSEYGIFGQRFSQIVPVELMGFGVE